MKKEIGSFKTALLDSILCYLGGWEMGLWFKRRRFLVQ